MRINRMLIYLCLMPLFIACQAVTLQPERPTIILPSGTGATVTPTTASSVQAPTGSPVDFVWRIKGDPYRLARPSGMAFDAQDNLYVIDGSNHRIQKFDRDGKFLLQWGGMGDQDGQFIFRNGAEHPGAIAINAQGLVYVADYKGIVQVFDGQGNFLRKWGGGRGLGDGQFITPRCMAFDKQGYIYMSDGDSDEHEGIFRIQKFDADGNFLFKWSIQGFCMALDGQSNIYVGNPFKYRIEKYDSQGTLLSMWGSQGNGDGQFAEPEGIAADAEGNIYVSDNRNNFRIQQFDSDGNFLGKWGSWGSEDGQFNYPGRIAIDSQGNIYVADDGDNDSIQKFRPTLIALKPMRD